MYYQLICQDESINQVEFICHQNQLDQSDKEGYPFLLDTKEQASYYLEEEGVTELDTLFVELPIGFSIFFEEGLCFIYPYFKEDTIWATHGGPFNSHSQWGFWSGQLYPLDNRQWLAGIVPIHFEESYSKAFEIKELLESVYQMGKKSAAEYSINWIKNNFLD